MVGSSPESTALRNGKQKSKPKVAKVAENMGSKNREDVVERLLLKWTVDEDV